MTDFVKVVALGAATILTARGLVHFDHESSDETARQPEVPLDQVADLVERGLIVAPEVDMEGTVTSLTSATKPAAAPATDKRKAALAKANAARAAKAAAKKAAKAPAAAPATDDPDAPPVE